MILSGKTVLVTGGAGFLGNYVVKELQNQYCNIITPRSKEYDLRGKWNILNLLNRFKPDVVVHLAATVGGIGANRDNPGKFFYDNAIMGIQLMECARLLGVEKFVTMGTVCSYPKYADVPFKESELWDGYPEETNAPYGLAKKMLLVQSQAYRDQYGFNGIYLVLVNLYGPGDNCDLHTSHVIPAIIRKCIEAKSNGATVVLWGDGTPTREFLYVKDAAKAIVMATKMYDGREPVNIGSGIEISMVELAQMIAELVGYEGEFIWDTSKPNGQPRRCLDVSSAERQFDFRATTSLKEGLIETIEWYITNWRFRA